MRLEGGGRGSGPTRSKLLCRRASVPWPASLLSSSLVAEQRPHSRGTMYSQCSISRSSAGDVATLLLAARRFCEILSSNVRRPREPPCARPGRRCCMLLHAAHVRAPRASLKDVCWCAVGLAMTICAPSCACAAVRAC